jgi:hypothetical protein
METAFFSETSVSAYKVTRRHNQEQHLHLDHSGTLKSQEIIPGSDEWKLESHPHSALLYSIPLHHYILFHHDEINKDNIRQMSQS